jgi:transposase-like protein
MVLSPLKRHNALPSSVVSSHDPRWIVLRAVLLLSPPRLENQRLLLCHPGGRSKVGEERAIRVQTEGFACPNRACGYYGISDAQIHAVVSDGSYGKAEQIQRWRCQAYQAIFRARLHTPLYRLKTPSQQVALVLGALAEGLDLSAAERIFGFRHATITHWLVRAGAHAQTLHERSFCQLTLPHLQLDELRTRVRSHTQVLWLWVAIDPLTTCIPVLQLGPRTHQMAQLLIHRLREQLAAFLLAPLYQRRPPCLFLRAHRSLW